jgi:hypothetical protein
LTCLFFVFAAMMEFAVVLKHKRSTDMDNILYKPANSTELKKKSKSGPLPDLTVSILVDKQHAIQAKSYFWTKFLYSLLGYDHVVLLLALIKLDYNLTSTSWPSSSGLKSRRRTYLTILKRTWSAHSKMVRYVLLRPLRP